MKRTDLVIDAVMISAGIAYYLTSIFYIYSKLAGVYSLNLI